ncbi:MAG: glutathione S-transferase family protein [Thermodesulfobacteriales bacterium]|nr:MAG: glutathione S-transferase family protein [Thermodesulfobacteriales bacterium]
MGLLVEGKWQDKWYDTKSTGGRFVRRESQFREWVTADGSSGFKAEPGRYHLYVSLACPWAHRTLIFRKLKKLEGVISLSIVYPLMEENGWEFSDYESSIEDSVNGSDYLHQIYTTAKPDYTGRVTVPVLWDKEKKTIVNNESSEIILMLNSEFDEFGNSTQDFYPPELRDEIDQINEAVYHNINNGVYKCGFATTQQAYEEAFNNLFSTLDQIENILSKKRYIVGDKLTLADWRLFTTLLRFDSVYYTHFKCNLRRIEEYPNLSNYLRELYQYPGVEETVNFKHIKEHYFKSHKTINPTGIVPSGPELDLSTPHNRSKL